MEEMTVQDFVNTYKELIDRLLERQDQLEDLLFSQVLNPAKEAMNKFEKDGRKADFMGKHKETLEAFNDKLRAIEGDDFDLAEQAFEDYDAMEEKPESDVYVAALVAKVTEQIDKLKKAFGAETIEVKDEGEGESTEVIADGEVVAEAANTEEEIKDVVEDEVVDNAEAGAEAETEVKEVADEAAKEEEKDEGEAEAEVIDTDSEEYKKELAEFEKSLGL